MFTALSNLALRRPRRMAVLCLVFFAAAGVYGGPAAGMLKAHNGFQDPSSPSSREQTMIQNATNAEDAPGIMVIVDGPPTSRRVRTVARLLRGVPGVASVMKPPPTRRSIGRSPLVSRNGRLSVVAATLYWRYDSNSVVNRIKTALRRVGRVLLGGYDVAGQEISSQATKDLGFGELLAFPLLVILSLAIFRGVAAFLPVAVGGVSVLGAFVLLRVINYELALSVFALNLVIGLGLGLAVDYSLLLVWRFREELSNGAGVPDALRTTLATAGRTVMFSAATVTAAMLTLTLFPQRFLVSMGIGGAATALVSGAAALLVVPTMLVLLAGRIGRVKPAPEGTGRWYRISHAVMRRPALAAAGTTFVLLVVAFPTLNVRWTGVDATDLPSGQSAYKVARLLTRDFPAQDLNPITIAIHGPPSAGPQLASYERAVGSVPGVTGRPGGRARFLGSDTWELALGSVGDPLSSRSQRILKQVRLIPSPYPTEIGGGSAGFVDQKAAIAHALPLALSVLAGVTLLILWLMTGSVVLPIKALLMNVITAATATGLLVFVFQDGRLEGLLAYTSQGGIEQTDFLVLVAMVFALSTDYGVLLMTRIKEARDAGRDNREAIAVGLEHTGRVVTASAALLAVAIGAFATSKIVFLKEIGLGAVVAVMVDAFVVRSLLVPSLMAVLGEWNWWSPRPLRWLHERIGVDERTRALQGT